MIIVIKRPPLDLERPPLCLTAPPLVLATPPLGVGEGSRMNEIRRGCLGGSLRTAEKGLRWERKGEIRGVFGEKKGGVFLMRNMLFKGRFPYVGREQVGE